VKIVSFSGIDGAGKSTQICALESWLHEIGLNTRLVTFWDDVVVGSTFRELMSHAAFNGDRGIGSPEKPLERRDKNVTSWPMTIARYFLYFADALNLRRIARTARKGSADVVIFDRYIYDELANLPLHKPIARFFIRFMQKLVPAPDIAYVIDADPAVARARKPEYPLQFLLRNREAYLALARMTGDISVIAPGSVEEAQARVKEVFLRAARSESPLQNTAVAARSAQASLFEN
jgi:thymidylate kinase